MASTIAHLQEKMMISNGLNEGEIINPHFDHERYVWSDEYSGLYQPVDYSVQFDYEWKLFLEKKIGFCRHTGVETDDEWIDDRIYEITGVEGFITGKKYLEGGGKAIGGLLHLEPKFPIEYFKDKRCLDAGCGAGRWTKALLALGGKVKSIDMSDNGIVSTRRFNSDVEKLNMFDIVTKRPDLKGAFDFTICWGVVMCTHDPKVAFQNVASTVKSGGKLYIMVYAPTYHNSPAVIAQRQHYHRHLKTIEEKLQYAYEISDRPENAINQFDMLNTFYNWTIPEDVVYRWFAACGYRNIITLNAKEANKCGYHVVGEKI